MAETLPLVSSIVSLQQVFQRALGASTLIADSRTSRDNDLLLHYSLLIGMLGECAGIIQTSAESRPTSITIIEATRLCTNLGQTIAYRIEKIHKAEKIHRVNKTIHFTLAPLKELQAKIDAFQSSVILLHGLTQNLLLQDLIQSQNDLRSLTANAVVANHSTSRGDQASIVTEPTSLTNYQGSVADVVTLADQILAQSVTRGVHLGADPSLILGTITMTHEAAPRFVPVRAKYDTACDVNFIPSSLIEKHGLSSQMVELESHDDTDGAVFLGLNNQEYVIQHTITLQWCEATMHRVRTTEFHVAENLPYDMLLGNPFILENRIFSPPRVALPLRRKHRSSAQKEEEAQRKQAHSQAAAEESQRERNEDATRRALEREARRHAQAQTSASSMLSASANPIPTPLSPGIGTATPVSEANSFAFDINLSQPSSSATQTPTSLAQGNAVISTVSGTTTSTQAATDLHNLPPI